MVDYSKLADHAKGKQEADRLEIERHKKLRSDPCGFFERLKTHLYAEMDKANVELNKRRAATFDKYVLPGFSEEVFLTYGTDSLCRVGLGVIRGSCRVTAVISGPPNGYEISRKEYLCEKDEGCSEILAVIGDGKPAEGTPPEVIATDIIAGVLIGHFD